MKELSDANRDGLAHAKPLDVPATTADLPCLLGAGRGERNSDSSLSTSPRIWRPLRNLYPRIPFARLLFFPYAVVLLIPGMVLGQGMLQPVVMRTGTGTSLSSMSVNYTSSAVLSGVDRVALDFGFATQEQAQPGQILDSFTVSITGPNGTGYLVTVDGSGTYWTPNVPGALPVSTSSLQWQTSPFLVSSQGYPNLASYALTYSLPSTWQSVPLTINFDLFDNQNNLGSLAYFYLPVPEPGTAALILMGMLAWRFRRKP